MNNKTITTDVDIDCYNRAGILHGLPHIIARITNGTNNEKHPSGVYFQNMPVDSYTRVGLIDYKTAPRYGYFKLDFLNVTFYEDVRDEAHLIELMDREPDWGMLLNPEITDNIFHIKGHSDLLRKFKPTTVEELAAILAIIRPSKAHLQQATWSDIKELVWAKTDGDAYQFKKGHAIAYALGVIVNLHLYVEKLNRVSVDDMISTMR